MPIMASHTYDTLVAALELWEEEGDTEFEEAIDNIISMGEIKLIRDLDLEIFNQALAVSLSSSNAFVNRPAGLLAVKSFYYVNASNEFMNLELKSEDYLKEYWKNPLLTGTPKYFSEHDVNQFKIAPTPNGNFSAEIRALVRPEALSPAHTSTWISQNAGDLLFYACLLETEVYLKEDMLAEKGRIAGIASMYQVKLGPARMELNKMANAEYKPTSAGPKTE